MRFFALKKNKIAAVNLLLLLLPHFCTYFSLQTLLFLSQEYFFSQGAGYLSYAAAYNAMQYSCLCFFRQF